MVKRFTISHLT